MKDNQEIDIKKTFLSLGIDLSLFDADKKYSDFDYEQVSFKINEDTYIFSQNDEGIRNNDNLKPHEYRTEIMTFEDFENNLDSAISGYYGSIEEVKKIYGDNWKEIVLECAFEQEL